MVEKCFTQSEAVEKVGKKVLAVNLPSVPKDNEGTVVEVIRSRSDDWRVRIQWRVPRTVSLVDAAEISFFKREKPAMTDLSKSAYEKSVEEIS
jgi:hypothetical protein